jgi:hypothetical protein
MRAEEVTAMSTALAYSGTFAGTADQVAIARHAVRTFLGGHPVTEEVVLVVSELVTNAVRHSASAGRTLTVEAEIYQRCVRVEVIDLGGPWLSGQQDDWPHGLAIVEALCGPHGWGIQPVPGRRRMVWARVPF